MTVLHIVSLSLLCASIETTKRSLLKDLAWQK